MRKIVRDAALTLMLCEQRIEFSFFKIGHRVVKPTPTILLGRIRFGCGSMKINPVIGTVRKATARIMVIEKCQPHLAHIVHALSSAGRCAGRLDRRK
jgi:hypothetical protein